MKPSITCCLDPNCSDKHCPGRELARQYHEQPAAPKPSTRQPILEPVLYGLTVAAAASAVVVFIYLHYF